MSHQTNILRIRIVHKALEELADEVVFVGGATVSLYTDRPTEEMRPTDDVDILIELAHYKDYAKVEDKLRAKGFANDMSSGVICRYIVQGIIVDIMPTSPEILGFTNRWYTEAYTQAQMIAIDDDLKINILTAPYFIATKLEAFKGRGGNDGRTSTDFEDIIFVLNNRTTIWQEFNDAMADLKHYLQTEFRLLLGSPYIEEWVSAHLEYHEQRRMNFIVRSMEDFAK